MDSKVANRWTLDSFDLSHWTGGRHRKGQVESDWTIPDSAINTFFLLLDQTVEFFFGLSCPVISRYTLDRTALDWILD